MERRDRCRLGLARQARSVSLRRHAVQRLRQLHVPRLESSCEVVVLELGLECGASVVLSCFVGVMVQALELNLVLLVETETTSEVGVADVANALLGQGKGIRLLV